MKHAILFSFLISILLFSNIAITKENSKFYVDGQIHPDYLIKIVINGKLVEEIIPDKDSIKIFVFDLDKNIINKGQNSVTVQYNVVRNIEQDVGSSRSFRFNIRYQADINNNDTVEKLIKIKGPEKPFPPIGTSDTLTEVFEFGGS